MVNYFVLASASPQRHRLLRLIIEDFDILSSEVDEEKLASAIADPKSLPKKLAQKKALDVALRIVNDGVVIGADTVVEIDGKLLNKPKSEEQARDMLKMLSNRTHNVITGVCVINTATGKQVAFDEKTSVTFGKLTDEDIEDYINTGEPLNKAGAYGIQGIASKFIERINGDYYNVVGLPVYRLNLVLRQLV